MLIANWLRALEQARPRGAPTPKPRRADQWHATLSFIGHDIDAVTARRAVQALAEVAALVPPHRVELNAMTHWPGSGAVVALPAHRPELQVLCDACTHALRRAGIPPLQVTRQPHLTLAYFDKTLAKQPWVDAVRGPAITLTVDTFELLINPGGRYDALAHWPLQAQTLAGPPQAGLFD